MNVLITGGNGYIAKSITARLKNDHVVTSISRQDFDLTNKKLVYSCIIIKFVIVFKIVKLNRLFYISENVYI